MCYLHLESIYYTEELLFLKQNAKAPQRMFMMMMSSYPSAFVVIRLLLFLFIATRATDKNYRDTRVAKVLSMRSIAYAHALILAIVGHS